MGKVTIALIALSTVVLLVTFGKGMSILHGGDVASHLYWSMAALLSALTANLVAVIHAAQSDRIIRQLRALLAQTEPGEHAASRAPAHGGTPLPAGED
jgi:hypothetical protein